MKEPVTIRFTSDSIGESLSLQCKGTMIHVRYKDIERIVERERSRGYVTGHYITGEDDVNTTFTDKDAHFGELVLRAIRDIDKPMLMYDGEKEAVRKALIMALDEWAERKTE